MPENKEERAAPQPSWPFRSLYARASGARHSFISSDYWPAAMVNVTVRELGAMGAVADALNVYVIGSALAVTAEMPVTTSADEVPRVIEPRLAAPEGAARATASVIPEGIGESIAAVIFWFVSFVVMP